MYENHPSTCWRRVAATLHSMLIIYRFPYVGGTHISFCYAACVLPEILYLLPTHSKFIWIALTANSQNMSLFCPALHALVMDLPCLWRFIGTWKCGFPLLFQLISFYSPLRSLRKPRRLSFNWIWSESFVLWFHGSELSQEDEYTAHNVDVCRDLYQFAALKEFAGWWAADNTMNCNCYEPASRSDSLNTNNITAQTQPSSFSNKFDFHSFNV